ncbi:MAG: hypothetical protein ACRDT6_18950 [Micromonosporaceae bacterium]
MPTPKRRAAEPAAEPAAPPPAAASEPVHAPLIFPVGHFTGGFPDADEPAEQAYHVRRGSELVALPGDAFLVWGFAHGTPDHPQPWTRQEVFSQARSTGLDSVPQLVRDLGTAGLVAEVFPGTPAAREFAETHQAHPTLLGLGNTADDVGTFSIGLVGTPMLQVSRAIFELWRWAPAAHNLWDVCQFFTENERAHGESDPEVTDPELLLTGYLGALHELLSGGAVYLDTATGA